MKFIIILLLCSAQFSVLAENLSTLNYNNCNTYYRGLRDGKSVTPKFEVYSESNHIGSVTLWAADVHFEIFNIYSSEGEQLDNYRGIHFLAGMDGQIKTINFLGPYADLIKSGYCTAKFYRYFEQGAYGDFNTSNGLNTLIKIDSGNMNIIYLD